MKPIYLALLVIAAQAFAQTNPPELGVQSQLGRVAFYKAFAGYSYFTPTAFSSQFRCVGVSEPLCQINVYNSLTDDEKAQIQQLTQSEGLKIVTFSSINSKIVSNINENFVNLPNVTNPQILQLNTLDMSSGNVPYASVAFRTDAGSANSLKSQYQTAGLGTYSVQFQLHAQKTSAYLGLAKPGCVSDTLSPSVGKGLWWSEAAQLIDTAVKTCGLESFGFRPDEADHELRLNLEKTFFKHVFLHGYFVKEEVLTDVRDAPYSAYDIADPTDLNCRVDLDLRAGAVPVYRCAGAGK